jgi:hypothetical protein
MKILSDRGKNSDPAGKRDISKIPNSTGRYIFPRRSLSHAARQQRNINNDPGPDRVQ